ncbi:MAG: hypothetical protein DHS20C15_01810 [Planctomycetota bacterium]|nr:MAG: hypothetical protein DHS20C15_01810 [Planctomycetota bacterium]
MSKGKSFVDVWSEGLRRLQSEALAPLTVISGEAPAVKERLIDAVITRARGEVEVFAPRAGESDKLAQQRLIDLWTTPTLFGGRQLVLARDVGKLFSGARAANIAQALERDEPPHRLLVTIEHLDGRTKLGKRLNKLGGHINLPVLRDGPPPWHQGGPYLQTDLNEWLVAESSLLGRPLDLRSAQSLAERIGNEPGRLLRTLDGLHALLDDGAALTPEFIAQHVRHSSVRLLGLWEDALAEGRLSDALQLTDRMQREGVHDPFGRLVVGALVTDTVLRGLLSKLGRVVEAHERLDAGLRAALTAKPWERRSEQSAELDRILGRGGPRVFLERDLRRLSPHGSRRAFRVGLIALRRLRDGEGASLHAMTVRLVRALHSKDTSTQRAQRAG